MLEDLEQGVDKADTKLNSAMKKMRKFIRDTEGELLFSIRGEHCLTSWLTETKSGWCIGILTVILLALLLAVILV